MHFSLLCERALSVLGLWHLQGPWNQSLEIEGCGVRANADAAGGSAAHFKVLAPKRRGRTQGLGSRR